MFQIYKQKGENMEPALSLQRTKFNQLIRWFTVCETHPDERFTALASGLGITPRALIQILIVTYKKRDHNLESYLLNDKLDMSTQYRYALTINQLLEPGRLMHGVLTYLNPNKWMCFMQTLHDVVHDPDPLFRLDYEKYDNCVSRVSEETIPPLDRGMAVGDKPNESGDGDIGLGFGGIAQPMSSKEIARERAKAEIKELIRTMLTTPISPKLFITHDQVLEQMITASIAELERKINEYLKYKTINRAVVKNLHGFYSRMFERTDQTIDEDRYWLDDLTQTQEDKIRIKNSILDLLAKLGGIETGGKRSRSKKRGRRRRKSIHRRKKSIRR